MLAESLPNDPAPLSVYLHFVKNALLPRVGALLRLRIHNFGTMLEPRWIVGTEFLDQ
jgi:hypothetical protein